MKLKEWRIKSKLFQKDIAKLARCDQSLISYIESGKRRASPGLALKIEQFTNGEVTIRDLLYPEK